MRLLQKSNSRYICFTAFTDKTCIKYKIMPEDKIQATDDTSKDNANIESEGQQEGADDKQQANNTDAGGDNGEGKGEGNSAPGNEGEKAKAPIEGEEDDGSEPDVRKRLSKQDFIIGRQRAKLAKSKANEDDDDDNNGQDNEDDEDDDVAPEDEALISRVVAKKFAPISKSL
jgi:hypothetical protein